MPCNIVCATQVRSRLITGPLQGWRRLTCAFDNGYPGNSAPQAISKSIMSLSAVAQNHLTADGRSYLQRNLQVALLETQLKLYWG